MDMFKVFVDLIQCGQVETVMVHQIWRNVTRRNVPEDVEWMMQGA
jgi:hypothetical protein